MDYDHDMRKSVIDQMMGELDDETSESLKKPKGPSGVEIAITVSPKSDGEAMDADGDMDGDMCMDPDCEDPMHDHTARDASKDDGEGSDYIHQLLKKLG